MTKTNRFRAVPIYLSVIAVAGLLAACGGGDGDGGVSPTTVSGTVAKGDPVPGATVLMTCANNAILSTATSSTGTYSVTAPITLPCIGTATAGGLSYRSILFSGNVLNFTAFTDLLAEVVLAASAGGSTSLTIPQFLTKIQSDAVFAQSVSSPANTSTYRATVISTVRAQLIAGGTTPANADALLAGASNFDTVSFVANGTGFDAILDQTAPVLQDSTGSVPVTVKAEAKTEGDKLPVPNSSGTGGTGGTGGIGG